MRRTPLTTTPHRQPNLVFDTGDSPKMRRVELVAWDGQTDGRIAALDNAAGVRGRHVVDAGRLTLT